MFCNCFSNIFYYFTNIVNNKIDFDKNFFKNYNSINPKKSDNNDFDDIEIV
jgi:hypothetical protein